MGGPPIEFHVGSTQSQITNDHCLLISSLPIPKHRRQLDTPTRVSTKVISGSQWTRSLQGGDHTMAGTGFR
ncbi:uncharacterized protein CMC5_059080 [Chondromyces crocatus]|uniref:Uncharacterized protein n=1 Tax=Chondromyces crocatus TaxID=52 RepID=A0A0K1ELE3_CHOCO|nr:uncharacterized protein CMC5_059080 [Chondromyces crocatus]